jgi:hypothetical protein
MRLERIDLTLDRFDNSLFHLLARKNLLFAAGVLLP